jgi:hypothetical protein
VDHHPERARLRRPRCHRARRGEIAPDAHQQCGPSRERRGGHVDEPLDLARRQRAELAGVPRDRDGPDAPVDRSTEDPLEPAKVQRAVIEERRGRDGDDGVERQRVHRGL